MLAAPTFWLATPTNEPGALSAAGDEPVYCTPSTAHCSALPSVLLAMKLASALDCALIVPGSVTNTHRSALPLFGSDWAKAPEEAPTATAAAMARRTKFFIVVTPVKT